MNTINVRLVDRGGDVVGDVRIPVLDPHPEIIRVGTRLFAKSAPWFEDHPLYREAVVMAASVGNGTFQIGL